MEKASTLKIAAQLRELTSYCTVRENDTRWLSTFESVQQFLKIQTQLSGIVELLLLLPNHLEIAYLTNAFESLKKFDSVTLMLQREGCLLSSLKRFLISSLRIFRPLLTILERML